MHFLIPLEMPGNVPITIRANKYVNVIEFCAFFSENLENIHNSVKTIMQERVLKIVIMC